jgi:hypothetical protein
VLVLHLSLQAGQWQLITPLPCRGCHGMVIISGHSTCAISGGRCGGYFRRVWARGPGGHHGRADNYCLDDPEAHTSRRPKRHAPASMECGCNNSSANISMFMTWADAHGVGYEAWTWDTWGACNLSLITNYNGTPYGAYGTYVQQHFRAMSGG